MKRRSCRPTHGSSDISHSRSFHPLFHAFHVLLILFSFIFTFLHVTHHHLSNNPPAFHSTSQIASPFVPVPPASVIPSFDKLPISLLCQPSITRRGLRFPRYTNFLFTLLLILAGDINLNPGPSVTSSSLNLAHLNTWSASSITSKINKPAVLQEFISDNSLDLLALTETWLPPDTLPSTLNSITPANYSIIHSPRLHGKGGGIAFIYRSYLKIVKLTLPAVSSFEALCIKLSVASSSFTILTIYRPPKSKIPVSVFFDEFSSLLEILATSPSELIITGDFNFHVDDPTSPGVSSLHAVFDTFDLTQLVSFPTHTDDHTLEPSHYSYLFQYLL